MDRNSPALALEALVEKYGDALLRYARLYVPDAAAAEDFVEDSFVALFLRPVKLKSEAHQRAYLYKAVRCRAVDFFRKNKRCVPLTENLPAEDLFESAERREEAERLYLALFELPPDYRDAATLVYLEGFSAEECAQIMKKSKKQVYNLLARAKNALKRKLGDSDEQ